MSVTPAPCARPCSTRYGRSATVPSGNTVSIWPMRRSRGPPGVPAIVPTTVSPSSAFGWTTTVAPRRSRNRGRPAADAIHTGLRVAAAVDVDERRQVLEIGRQRLRDESVEARQLVRRTTPSDGEVQRLGHRTGRVYAAVRLAPGDLAGPLSSPAPCASSRSACSKVPTSTGWSRRPRSRSPWAGRGLVRPANARASLAGPPGSACAGPRLAGRGRNARRLVAASTDRSRRGHGRGRRPSLVGPRALDRDLSVARRGAGARDRRRRVPARRAQRHAVSLGAPDRRAAAAAGPSVATNRGRARHAAPVDPRRRPADPDRLDQRDERQDHGHAAHHPHPGAGRASRRHHDLGRDPRGRARDRGGRLDRPGRRPADPGPERRGRGRPRDRARAGCCCAAWGTSRTMRAC